MTKIEKEILSLNLKIKSAEKEYERAREALARQLASQDGIFDPMFVKQHAERMADQYAKIESLNEQIAMLEYLKD